MSQVIGHGKPNKELHPTLRSLPLPSLELALALGILFTYVKMRFFTVSECLPFFFVIGILISAPVLGQRLENLSREERQSIESVCSAQKFLEGPAAYNRCLESQLAKLRRAPRRPNLSNLSREERQSIESVCSAQKFLEGPAAYNRCLNQQMNELMAYSESRMPETERNLRSGSSIQTPTHDSIETYRAPPRVHASEPPKRVFENQQSINSQFGPQESVSIAPRPTSGDSSATLSRNVLIFFVLAILGFTVYVAKKGSSSKNKRAGTQKDRKSGRSYAKGHSRKEQTHQNRRNSQDDTESKKSGNDGFSSGQNSQGENTNSENKSHFSGNPVEQYYAQILGLPHGYSSDDIKKRYRVLAQQYHPDRVQNLGPKLREVAETEMKAINEAYSYFKNIGKAV